MNIGKGSKAGRGGSNCPSAVIPMAEVNIVSIGIALILIGFLVAIIGSFLGKGSDVKVGFGGFIGPFAFGWANDPQMLKWIIGLTIVAAVIFVLLALKGIRI